MKTNTDEVDNLAKAILKRSQSQEEEFKKIDKAIQDMLSQWKDKVSTYVTESYQQCHAMEKDRNDFMQKTYQLFKNQISVNQLNTEEKNIKLASQFK